MRRRFLKTMASGLALPFLSPLDAFAASGGLQYPLYDSNDPKCQTNTGCPIIDSFEEVPGPGVGQTVSVVIDYNDVICNIPDNFYGINVNPGSAGEEFGGAGNVGARLLGVLRPDAVRVFSNARTDYIPASVRYPSGKIEREVLYTEDRQYHWASLDGLIEKIYGIGAEPYLALGFGAPEWMTRHVINSEGKRIKMPPLPSKYGEYANMMARVVDRYANNYPIKRVTVDNEPENVHYLFGEYCHLFKLARQAITNKTVQVGGPVIGYAKWPQVLPEGIALSDSDRFNEKYVDTLRRWPKGWETPENKNGEKSYFYFKESMKRIQEELDSERGPGLDFVDWHIYTSSYKTVEGTLKTVRSSFPDKKLVISELNRDWVYNSGDSKRDALSERRNKSWISVPWLARLYDKLQVPDDAGLRTGLDPAVDQVFYFAWRSAAMGLLNHHRTVVSPNFFLMWNLINRAGRKRVHTAINGDTHGAVGCIATQDSTDHKPWALVYNLSGQEVDVQVRFSGRASTWVYYRPYDEAWYNSLAESTDKQSIPQISALAVAGNIWALLPSPSEQQAGKSGRIKLPPYGFCTVMPSA